MISCFIYLCALAITPNEPYIQWDVLEKTTLSTEYEWLEESPRVKWLQWWMGVDQDGVYGRITHKHHRQWAMERNIPVRLYSTVSPNATFRPEVERWRDLVTEAVTHYGGFVPHDVNRMLWIMQCESGGDPNAANPSGASGLFQQMQTWWDNRAKAAGFEGASPYDPTANINVSAYLIYRSPNSWHHWVCS
jgi:hypothetical protein